ncbi:MAG: hypothetical protein ACR2J8_11270, partial [Thermomicrobiales bacterium]
GLPETPHEVILDRGRIDDLLDRIRGGERTDLLEALLDCVAWDAFASEDGYPLSPVEHLRLQEYYRDKWADIGPLYIAELLSTEFMTEQRARGDVAFSERLVALGQAEPELWAEIRQFFRRKEIVTGLLLLAHRSGDQD